QRHDPGRTGGADGAGRPCPPDGARRRGGGAAGQGTGRLTGLVPAARQTHILSGRQRHQERIMAKVKRRRTPGKTRGAAARADATMASDPVDAMMLLVESDGWRAVTFGRIATASGMSLSDLYSQYKSRSDLLVAYAARVDAAMLAALGPTPLAADGDVAKDRLFEAIMARLDAMAPHKAAIRVLMR